MLSLQLVSNEVYTRLPQDYCSLAGSLPIVTEALFFGISGTDIRRGLIGNKMHTQHFGH